MFRLLLAINALVVVCNGIAVKGKKDVGIKLPHGPLYRTPKQKFSGKIEIREYMSSVWVSTKPRCSNPKKGAALIDLLKLSVFSDQSSLMKKSSSIAQPLITKYEYADGRSKCDLERQEMYYLSQDVDAVPLIPLPKSITLQKRPFSKVYAMKYNADPTDEMACSKQWDKLIEELNSQGAYFRADEYFCARYEPLDGSQDTIKYELLVPALILQERG